MGNIDSIINPGGGGQGGGGGSGSVPGCLPGGGDQTIFTPSAIRALGARIETTEPMLEKVASSLEEADVEAESWSSKGIAIANVYPGALDFVKNDLKSKTSQLREIADRLKGTAATWENAEQASTVQTR